MAQESLKVQEFYLRVEEEEVWIREKEPLACSVDYGRDKSSVVKLMQKHQALEAEIRGMCVYTVKNETTIQQIGM